MLLVTTPRIRDKAKSKESSWDCHAMLVKVDESGNCFRGAQCDPGSPILHLFEQSSSGLLIRSFYRFRDHVNVLSSFQLEYLPCLQVKPSVNCDIDLVDVSTDCCPGIPVSHLLKARHALLSCSCYSPCFPAISLMIPEAHVFVIM